MNYDFDVIIIGSGPAGSITSIYLSDMGFNVCLVEKKKFPREILCGEFLSKEVVETLRRLNLFEEFLSLHPNPIKSFRFINDDGQELSERLNFPAYGLRRSVFDNFLLTVVKRKNIHVLQPAEVKEVYRQSSLFSFKIKTEDSKYLTLYSKFAVAAYGKQNTLDKSFKRNFINKKSNLNGIKFHIDKACLKNFENQEIRIYSTADLYCGLNAVDGDYATLCFLENKGNFKASSREHLINFISGSRKFQDIFDFNYKEFIREAAIYGTGNIFFGKRNVVENGVFMIGDAAGVIAPVVGDGIGMAFQAAGLLSEILFEIDLGHITSLEAENLYKIRWVHLFRKRLNTALFIQKLILENYSRKIGIQLLKNIPYLFSYFIRITRD